jgi:hypothetical protein
LKRCPRPPEQPGEFFKGVIAVPPPAAETATARLSARDSRRARRRTSAKSAAPSLIFVRFRPTPKKSHFFQKSATKYLPIVFKTCYKEG